LLQAVFASRPARRLAPEDTVATLRWLAERVWSAQVSPYLGQAFPRYPEYYPQIMAFTAKRTDRALLRQGNFASLVTARLSATY
jgi:hypothetical protein